MAERTILLYGRSRSGKTSQIGEFAEYLRIQTGKNTLLYTIDKGGVGPVKPLIKLGVIDAIVGDDLDAFSPWHFMNKAAKGEVRVNGKWVKADLSKYAMVAIESLTGFSDAFMNDLAQKSAAGLNIGGGANVSFTEQCDGETIKIGGNNMSHYNVVQTRILDEVWRSQKLKVPYLLWTASASKDDDPNAGGKVIGPNIAGKAMTAEMLRQFDLTFRLDCLAAQQGKPERHILYNGNTVDLAAGNAVALGNTRLPLGATELPATIEPASLVKAVELIDKGEREAMEAARKRIESATKK